MIARLLGFGIRRYVKGPGRSWVFTSVALLGLRLVKSATGRRELIDIGKIKPGQRIEIEHLEISHRGQIRDMKKTRKADRRTARSEKRRAKKAARADNRGEPAQAMADG